MAISVVVRRVREFLGDGVSMVEIGHKLVSELHGPNDLVEYARLAEESALEFANVSDHYHPWLSEQGESPMVWNVLGAIAQATDDLESFVEQFVDAIAQHRHWQRSPKEVPA